jgi:hypothetical protein
MQLGIALLRGYAEQLVAPGWEVIDGRAHHAIGERLIEIAHGAGHLGMRSGDQL